MFPNIDYLAFMLRWSGKARYDLATSGIAPLPASELGAVVTDDFSTRDRFTTSVAAYYRVSESEVVPCLGSSGALFVASGALLEPGRRVLVESPCYEPLWRIAQALGAGVDFFKRRAERGFAVEVEAVLAALQPETALAIITNPHNPTGVENSRAELEVLARELEARDVWLLVDEVYLDAVRPGATARHFGERVLSCSSITKCWGAPWARAGWILGPKDFVKHALRVERCTVGLAPPSCWAWGSRAFEKHPELRERAQNLQAGKRRLVEEFVARHAHRFLWSNPPDAIPFGWLCDKQGTPLTPLLEQAIQSAGVLLAPGEFFGDPAAFRLGWTCPIDTLRDGLTALESILP